MASQSAAKVAAHTCNQRQNGSCNSNITKRDATKSACRCRNNIRHQNDAKSQSIHNQAHDNIRHLVNVASAHNVNDSIRRLNALPLTLSTASMVSLPS
eukprot:1272988-Amphidinium_carterae.1